jgi:hypothetical protein
VSVNPSQVPAKENVFAENTPTLVIGFDKLKFAPPKTKNILGAVPATAVVVPILVPLRNNFAEFEAVLEPV